jgi:exopolyphosphatase/guanosine-5'-triphosphate,3'-diphosphate pyrophosphatase
MASTRASGGSTSGTIAAFFDIGTNAIRMLLARINRNHTYTILSKQREVVRLGEGEFTTQKIQSEPIRRAVLVCSKFARMARSYGAQEIVAVATSATREAKNQLRFLQRLEKKVHIDARVISGKEEARLIYLGVCSGMNLQKKRALFIDIGGGSTELIVGDQHKYYFLDSLKLGAIRLTSTFFDNDETDAMSPQRYKMVQDHIRNVAVAALRRLRRYNFDLAIGSSGTIVNLAQIAANLDSRQSDRTIMTRPQLRAAAKLICSLPLDKRRQISGINPDRADIIVAGTAILETLMDELGLSKISVSERGLREGLLIDHISRQSQMSATGHISLRERTVLQLGQSCGFDQKHAEDVARIALELFDTARSAGLHTLGSWEREMLEYTAMLHDIGMFLSFDGHQTHSAYFIRNAELLGFDQKELTIMATLAEFHRKTLPRKKHQGYAMLDKASRDAVLKLSIFLRLAESLDRSRSGIIEHARIVRGKNRVINLAIKAKRDCALEIWGVRNHVRTFKKVFGQEFAIIRAGGKGKALEATI